MVTGVCDLCDGGLQVKGIDIPGSDSLLLMSSRVV